MTRATFPNPGETRHEYVPGRTTPCVSAERTDTDDSGRSSLARLRFGFQVLYAVAFTVLLVGVGATPDGWGLALGITLAAFFAYWGFREEIEQHLTGPQEWASWL